MSSVSKIGSVPLPRHTGGQRSPASSAILGAEYSSRIKRGRVADGPSLAPIMECDMFEGRQSQPGDRHPIATAILRSQNDAAGTVRVGMYSPADYPAVLAVDKVHRFQTTGGARPLNPPLPSTILGMQNHPAIADGPALIRIQKKETVQLGIIEHHWRDVIHIVKRRLCPDSPGSKWTTAQHREC